MNPAFFEPIYLKNQPFTNGVEELFYWEGISDRLGCRRFTVIHGNLELLAKQPESKWKWVKTALKITLCAYPPLCLFCLIVKSWTHYHFSKKLPPALDLLKPFQAQLQKDLKSGKVVLEPEVIKREYQSLLNQLEVGDPSVLESYQTIINREKVRVELQLREQSHKEFRLPTELLVMKKLGVASKTREITRRAEANFLRRLLEGSTIDLNALQKNLLKCRLSSVTNFDDKKCDLFADFILSLQSKADAQLEKLEKTPLPEELTALARLNISNSISEFRRKIVRDLVKEFLEKHLKDDTPPNLSLFDSECATFLRTYTEKNALKAVTEFYTNWGSKIEQEFIQGTGNSNDVLGEGLCFPISIRWAKKEMENPNLSADEIIEEGRIYPSDRFGQALYVAAHQKESLRTKRDQTVRYFHPIEILKLEKLFGLSKIRLLAYIEDFGKLRDSFETAKRQLEKNHGVTVAALPGHQIYLRYDLAKNIFRIGDPNIGILKLDNAEEFHACLTDLVGNFYSCKNNLIRLFQLDVAEAAQSPQAAP